METKNEKCLQALVLFRLGVGAHSFAELRTDPVHLGTQLQARSMKIAAFSDLEKTIRRI